MVKEGKHVRYWAALWIVLVLVGLWGAIRYSAVFFGLFTVGFFLIFYDLKKPSQSPPTSSTPPTSSIRTSIITCSHCGMTLHTDADFCPRCGEKVEKI